MVSTRFPHYFLLTKKLKAGRCGTANNVAVTIIKSNFSFKYQNIMKCCLTGFQNDNSTRIFLLESKSDNLQYNTLVCWNK